MADPVHLRGAPQGVGVLDPIAEAVALCNRYGANVIAVSAQFAMRNLTGDFRRVSVRVKEGSEALGHLHLTFVGAQQVNICSEMAWKGKKRFIR